jgi:hypothetical protein
MVKYSVERVEHAWTDNGTKMWNVEYVRLSDGAGFWMRHWAKDEIDAYNIALNKLGADND